MAVYQGTLAMSFTPGALVAGEMALGLRLESQGNVSRQQKGA